MAIFSLKLLIYSQCACFLMIAGLCSSFRIEQETPQQFMGYVVMFILYCIFGLPLNLLVASVIEFSWKFDRWHILPLLTIFVSIVLFLQTDRILGPNRLYFMSNPEKAPIVIGRSLEFLNPSPKTIQSNVATYFPLLTIMTFFLPLILFPLLRKFGARLQA